MTELQQAIRLGRQLRRDDASPVEATETILKAFDRPEPRMRALREAFMGRALEGEVVL